MLGFFGLSLTFGVFFAADVDLFRDSLGFVATVLLDVIALIPR
jgi:hypothetical protein